jgi:hypothetical protein
MQKQILTNGQYSFFLNCKKKKKKTLLFITQIKERNYLMNYFFSLYKRIYNLKNNNSILFFKKINK